jgi:hypothetical protein
MKNPDCRPLRFLRFPGLPLLLAVVACDGSAPAIDAAMPVESRGSQIELRIDVVPEKPASMTALAYRAVYSGISHRDVLGLVDPLAGAGLNRPAGECQLRDLDRASADLAAHGDAIELRELKGVAVASVGVDEGTPELVRLSPRMFPDIAASVGGVVAEGGPVGLAHFPQRLRITQSDVAASGAGAGAPDLRAVGLSVPTGDGAVGVPTPAWIKHINGAAPLSGTAIDVASGLRLILTAPGRDDTAIELRPFGATVALSCSVPLPALASADSNGSAIELEFGISRQVMSGLIAAAGGAPGAPIAAALDVVRRSEGAMTPSGTEIALEIRTSTLVELRP